MPAPPLTHHEILGLAEPFARSGWRIDLAGTRRENRQLRFAPSPGQASDAPTGFRSWLDLDASNPRRLRLVRTVRGVDGRQATLKAGGADLAALLASIEAVPADRHLPAGQPSVSRSYEVAALGPAGASSLVLVEGRIDADGLLATLRVPDVRGLAAELVLRPTGPTPPSLPEDLVAVLGWDWARLVPDSNGWSTRLRLRGDLAARTRRAESALEQLARHLATTLAAPPAEYHVRLRRARWGVFARRGIPTFTALGLTTAVLGLALLRLDLSMAQWIALYHVPTVIVALSFTLQELPRFEIPPWPRPLPQRSWFSG